MEAAPLLAPPGGFLERAMAGEAIDMGAAALLIASGCPMGHSPSHIGLDPVWRRAEEAGIPIVQPAGGHAVYIDARRFLPHIPPLEYPGQSLAIELYKTGGIRGCEIGTAMFGLHPDGTEQPAHMDLVRLAIPRRMYTQAHMDYVIEVVASVYERREELRGMKFIRQPRALRHFTGRFDYV